MADVNANIGVEIDASNALAQLKALQRGLSNFHTSIARSSDAAISAQRSLQKNLIDSINSIGGFSAELRTVRTTAESFTNSLEKNKFSMREYFRYAGASTKTFGRLFTNEFDTISKVAEDRVKRMQTQYIKMGRDATGAMKAIAVMPDQLDMSNYSTQLQMAAQRQAILNQLIKQGSTNLLNFGKNTQWAGRQLMVGFTLPLMTLGSTASRVFMDMETAAIKFRKVYGDLFTPAEETEKALENIRQLATEFTKYGVAAAKTIDLAAQAAAAGFQGIDLQRQVEQANRLAVLGQVEQQQALDTTISLQNAFKTSSAELAEQINFLNIVENQTVTSLEDITIAIPKVAPVIQQLGGDVKDLAFFLTAMREGGINASEGANALKSGLGSLINPTAKASAMLMDMGINIEKIVESNKGDLRATVVEFARALDTLDPLQRARAIEQLFGKFQFARLSTLFSNVAKDGTQASRVLDIASESASSLAFIAEKELGITANSAMNKFRKAVEDLKIAIEPVGKIFLEVVTPFVEFIAGILDRFNNLSEGTRKAIARITFIIGGIGPVAIMTFGLLANALANIIKVANLVRNGFLRLSGQSTVLGEQTQYLTMEQLEAAAVASSLDQAHSNLTQQFTVEAGVLERLIGVYQRATVAANNFKMANPGMFVPNKGTTPIKRAGGGKVSGPGTSTSDSIPAYLSDGEYVVKSDAVDQYGVPFFDALNAQKFSIGGIVKRFLSSNVASKITSLFTGKASRAKKSGRFVGSWGSALPKVINEQLRSGRAKGSDLISYFTGSISSGRYSHVAPGTNAPYWQRQVDLGSFLRQQGVSEREIAAAQRLVSMRMTSRIDPTRTYSDYTFGSVALKETTDVIKMLERRYPGIRRQYQIDRLTPGRRDTIREGRSTSGPSPTPMTATALGGRKSSYYSSKSMKEMFGPETLWAHYEDTAFNRFINRLASRPDLQSMTADDLLRMMTGQKIPGLNNGIISIPGNGNKDTFPAMLTPGEAVIPKEQNKKYGSLVRGIIADNIPGFAKGVDEVKSAYDRRKNKPIGGVLAPTAVNTAHPEGLFSILDISSEDASQVLSIGMQDIIRQTPGVSIKGIEDEVNAWKDRNADLLKAANERALQGVDLDEAFLEVRTKFNKDMEDLGGNVSKLKSAADRHLPRLTQDFEEAQTYARKMNLDLRTAEGITRLATDLPNNTVAQQLTTRGKFQNYNPARAATMTGLGGSFTQYGVPSFFILDERLNDLRVSTEHLSSTIQAQTDVEQKSRGKETRAEVAERRSGNAVLDKGSKKRQKGKAKRKRGTPATPQGDTTVITTPTITDGPETGKDKMSQLEKETEKAVKDEEKKTRAKGKVLGRLKGLKGLKFDPMSLFIIPSVLPMIEAIPSKLAGVDSSILKTTLKFATMGLALGPKGALAGAIAGLGKGIYDSFVKPAEKITLTSDTIKAGFTSSSSVAKLFGGQVSATVEDFTAMPGTIDKVTESLIKAKEQADQFKTIVNDLDESDPLKRFIDGIKGLSGSQLTGVVRTFVSTQIATGALPVEEAKQFTLNILTAAGAADKFGEVWLSIRASVATQAKAIETQFKKLADAYNKSTTMNEEDTKKLKDLQKEREEIFADNYVSTAEAVRLSVIDKEIDAINAKYKESAKSAKDFGNALLTFMSNIRAGLLDDKTIASTFDAITKSGMSAKDAMLSLGAAIKASNNEELIANWNKQKIVIDKISGSLKNAANAAKATFAALFLANKSPSEILNEYYASQGLPAPSGAGRQLVTADTWAKAYLKAFESLPESLRNALGGGTPPSDGTPDGASGTNKLVALINKEIDSLNKKADALKRVNDEIKRNNEYQMKQMDLSNQIAQAKASGDYIGATILQQQQAFNTAEFNKETEQLKIEDRIRNLENIVKRIESGEKLNSAEISIIRSLSKKYPTAKAATGGMIKVKKYASGGLIKGPGTGTSDSIVAKLDNIPRFGIGGDTGNIRVSAGEYIVKKDAVDFYTPEVMNSINNKSFQPGSNSVVYNTFNVDVSGVQDPKQAADLVMQRLQTISNKTNRTNIVSNNRSVAI